MTISSKKIVEKRPEYTDKCPRCGHWAREHERDLPGVYTVVQEANADRVCTHAVPVEGKDRVFRPCGCTVSADACGRLGNRIMIRVDTVRRK